MVNEVAVVLLFGLFGWKVTAIYIGTGLLVAIFGDYYRETQLEKWVEEYVYTFHNGQAYEIIKQTFKERSIRKRQHGRYIKRIWL
jgi:uncharacterized membrane protein YraQ (UPF0718 family)